MARFRCLVIVVMVFFALLSPCLEARKLPNTDNKDKKLPSSLTSLLLTALPKGTVPASSPSRKTHATLDSEKLFVRHLASIDRILRSVPSPGGVGH